MGKNKNKKYNLASRQEKILKRMAKPLYKKSDDSAYLVITQPFGMHPNPAERGTVDVTRISSWISWVFRRDSVVEAVYAMSTKDEVIVRLAEGINPTVLLGKHKYNNILSAGWPWNPSPASCVFEYDYQRYGDPSGHNWREYIASDVDASPHRFRNPYPVPTWTFRPSYLSGLAFALPDSLPRSRSPSPEPHSGGPSHIRRQDVKQDPSYSSYNTDNATAKASGSGIVEVEPSRQIDSSIAPNPSYEPAQALRDQIALLNASRSQASVRVKQVPFTQVKHEFNDSDTTRFRSETYDTREAGIGHFNAPPLGVKQEFRDVQTLAPVAEPSQALWDEWARYQSRQQEHGDPGMPHYSTGPMEQVPYTRPQLIAQTPPQSSGTTRSFDSIQTGKRC
jgi:hypothetical protein